MTIMRERGGRPLCLRHGGVIGAGGAEEAVAGATAPAEEDGERGNGFEIGE